MVEHASVQELKSALDAGTAHVIDVREKFEFDAGHVAGSVLIPMATIPLRVSEIPTDGDVYVICRSGARSWQVAAFLARQGVRVVNVEGGIGAWQWAGLPLQSAATAGVAR
jgi:rhodanese-related sulfurtransferase